MTDETRKAIEDYRERYRVLREANDMVAWAERSLEDARQEQQRCLDGFMAAQIRTNHAILDGGAIT